jgi:murein hydrolase activator
MTRRIALILTVACAAMLTAQESGNQKAELEKTILNRQQQLEDIQDSLKSKRHNLDRLKAEEKQQQKEIYALDEKLNLNYRLINKTGKQIEDIGKLIDDMEAQLQLNNEDLERRYEYLNQRLVWIYKRSRVSPLASALSAENPVQAARRLYMFSLLNNYDRQMIADIEALTDTIKINKTDLEKQQREIKSLKAEKEHQAGIIKADRGRRKDLLDDVRNQKNNETKAIARLDEDQNRLSSILETLLENQKILDTKAAAAFENLKGKLLWPVQGKVLRNFGKIKDLKYNTTINNPGIDIKAPAGQAVVASSSGEVVYISWLRGYGSFVILDHGGGYYSLYSHLDEIYVETGQYITAGEALATVGETGDLNETMLHFELRYGKEQLDPLPWLR